MQRAFTPASKRGWPYYKAVPYQSQYESTERNATNMPNSNLVRSLAADMEKLSLEDLRLVAVVIYEMLRFQNESQE